MPHLVTNDAERTRIRTLFLQMCVRAESMVRQAVRSAMERDAVLARTVIANDRDLDQLEVEIDRLCLRYIGLQQPQGADLRFITTVMKMVTDLERIGDLAVNIAERGIELCAGVGVEPGPELAHMSDLVADMVRDAVDAFIDRDLAKADGIFARDHQIDELNRRAFARWKEAVTHEPEQVDRGLAVVSMYKYLERVADHAVNLGTLVAFLEDGRDRRHGLG